VIRTPAWARHAMVSTSSPLAVQAALWALDQGGSAVDAAIASDAVLGAGQLIRAHDDGWFEGGADSRRDGVAFGR
jgi:gamma-glutamyltranspeptidase